MRDALSIMDQAIASAPTENGRPVLSTLQIRELMGSVPNAVFERLLEAVAAGQSAELMEQLNTLLNAGHSAFSLARQMVRYLRNTLMAKLGGEKTELLQISGDERARAARIGAAVYRRGDRPQPADHAQHVRPSQRDPGTSFPPRTGNAQAGARAAALADRAVAQRSGQRCFRAQHATEFRIANVSTRAASNIVPGFRL